METLLGTTATLESRGNEVRHLVQEGDFDLAMTRLLDLSKDFARSRELPNEEIAASAKHISLKTEVRRYGLSPEIKRDQDVLLIRILELTDLIETDAYRLRIVWALQLHL